MKRISRIVLILTLFSCIAYSQEAAPGWIHEPWRRTHYPAALWYVGFAENNVLSGANVAESLKSLERDALTKMVESVRVRVSGASVVENRSRRVSQSGGKSESGSGTDYYQRIYAEANAEITGASVLSYHDARNGRIYAIAAVKKNDLAAYYANTVESLLSEAERAIELANQSAGAGKKKDLDGHLAEAKKKIDLLELYRDLLIATDNENGLERAQGERTNALLKRIAAARVESESIMMVFVTGTETILTSKSDIVVSGLRAILNENNVRVAENRDEAGYILDIEAKIFDAQHDGRFFHSGSSVRVTLTNVKTGKNEVTTTVTGPKESGRDAHKAAENAFLAVVPEIWGKIKGRIMEN